jgi:hypothetical protein
MIMQEGKLGWKPIGTLQVYGWNKMKSFQKDTDLGM